MVDLLIDSPQLAQNGASETKPPRERKPDSDDLAQDLEKLWNGTMAYFWANWRRYESGQWDMRQLGEVHFAARSFLRQYREKGIRVGMALAREVVQLAETGLLVTDRKLMEIAEKMNGLSYALVVKIANDAAKKAIISLKEEISLEDLIDSFEENKVLNK